MKLAFYNVFQPNATFMDKVIVLFGSLGKVSHVEGVFSNGEWFSISPREKTARFKFIEPKPESWTYIELDLDADAEYRLRRKCQGKIGVKYAFIGAILSVTPLCFVVDQREFCSRMWTNFLIEEGFKLDPGCKNSPEELYQQLLKQIKI